MSSPLSSTPGEYLPSTYMAGMGAAAEGGSQPAQPSQHSRREKPVRGSGTVGPLEAGRRRRRGPYQRMKILHSTQYMYLGRYTYMYCNAGDDSIYIYNTVC